MEKKKPGTPRDSNQLRNELYLCVTTAAQAIVITDLISFSYSGSSTSNDWRMSVSDRGPSLAIAADGVRCQSRHQKEWHGGRANKGVAGKGKYFYEAVVEDEGLCRVGFSTTEVPNFDVFRSYLVVNSQ